MTVYPGLIDALSRWGMTTVTLPQAAAAAGGGRRWRRTSGGCRIRSDTRRNSRSCGGDTFPRTRKTGPSNSSYLKAADETLPRIANIEAARNGGYTTAVAFPNGKIFSGQGSVIDQAALATAPVTW